MRDEIDKKNQEKIKTKKIAIKRIRIKLDTKIR